MQFPTDKDLDMVLIHQKGHLYDHADIDYTWVQQVQYVATFTASVY